MSRYVVGIDLGTTNSALAFSATGEPTVDGSQPSPIETLPIPQVVGVNDVSERASCRRSSICPRPESFPQGHSTYPGSRRRTAWWVRLLGSMGPRSPAG